MREEAGQREEEERGREDEEREVRGRTVDVVMKHVVFEFERIKSVFRPPDGDVSVGSWLKSSLARVQAILDANRHEKGKVRTRRFRIRQDERSSRNARTYQLRDWFKQKNG